MCVCVLILLHMYICLMDEKLDIGTHTCRLFRLQYIYIYIHLLFWHMYVLVYYVYIYIYILYVFISFELGGVRNRSPHRASLRGVLVGPASEWGTTGNAVTIPRESIPQVDLDTNHDWPTVLGKCMELKEIGGKLQNWESFFIPLNLIVFWYVTSLYYVCTPVSARKMLHLDVTKNTVRRAKVANILQKVPFAEPEFRFKTRQHNGFMSQRRCCFWVFLGSVSHEIGNVTIDEGQEN